MPREPENDEDDGEVPKGHVQGGSKAVRKKRRRKYSDHRDDYYDVRVRDCRLDGRGTLSDMWGVYPESGRVQRVGDDNYAILPPAFVPCNQAEM